MRKDMLYKADATSIRPRAIVKVCTCLAEKRGRNAKDNGNNKNGSFTSRRVPQLALSSVQNQVSAYMATQANPSSHHLFRSHSRGFMSHNMATPKRNMDMDKATRETKKPAIIPNMQ